MQVELVYSLGLYTLLALLLIGGIFQYAFYRRLRSTHPGEWERLGRPSMFLNASIQSQARIVRYIWKREYSDLQDRRIEALALAVRFLTIIVGLVLAVFALAGFLVLDGDQIT